jgi:hypothetical protein
MFGILLSAFNSVLAWVFRSLLVKFVLFFALYFITSEFVGFIATLLPDGSSINGTLSSIDSGVWFFLDVFRIQTGLSAVVSAYATRFIIGSVSYPANGQSVQSVEYQSSGVIFNVQPTVREGVIDLSIDQQLSNFVATTTGVNNSPTLTKRALKTSVGMQDGDVIVLGGLAENKESGTSDGLSFLHKFLHTKGSESSRSEILLVLQVQRI